MKKPTIDEVEPIAFEFAKNLIISEGTNLNLNEINEKSMTMALEWLSLKNQRQKLIDDNYLNWINLKNYGYSSDFRIDYNKDYWVIGKPWIRLKSNPDAEFELIFGKCEKVDNNTFPPSITFNNVNARDIRLAPYEAFYILETRDFPGHHTGEKPKPPVGIKIGVNNHIYNS